LSYERWAPTCAPQWAPSLGTTDEENTTTLLYPTRITPVPPPDGARHLPLLPDHPCRPTDKVQSVTDTGGSFDLDLAAAQLRANSSDVRILVKVLVDQLSDALGSRLKVERTGGRFRKSDDIKSLTITMEDDQFGAVVDEPALRCTIGHSSGGIRIRSERVDLDTWLARLLTVLKAEAEHSQAVRQALENIVIGGNS
jgi:hypothetical protein